MKVLQITTHFSPNIGGIETHLTDLITALIKRGWGVSVLTYQPLTTKSNSKFYEKDHGLTIIRIPWFPGLFYKLISYPLLEFLYLFPGLFFVTPVILILKRPDLINAHGIVAGFVGVFWAKVFNKKIIVSTHSIYHFPKKGIYRRFVKWIFSTSSYCLGLSKISADEIISLGIAPKRVDNFTYWIDLENFRKTTNAKRTLGWNGEFVVLFVGRLVWEKGIRELLCAAKIWDKKINLKIIGSGPIEDEAKDLAINLKNVEFIGLIGQAKLPLYYSGADLLIVPSIHEEGFGRVILESLACGTPVIGSNRGAIGQALDSNVGKLIDINSENIKQAIEYYYNNRDELNGLAKKCREFAERRYSEKNVETIIKAYKQV